MTQLRKHIIWVVCILSCAYANVYGQSNNPCSPDWSDYSIAEEILGQSGTVNSNNDSTDLCPGTTIKYSLANPNLQEYFTAGRKQRTDQNGCQSDPESEAYTVYSASAKWSCTGGTPPTGDGPEANITVTGPVVTITFNITGDTENPTSTPPPTASVSGTFNYHVWSSKGPDGYGPPKIDPVPDATTPVVGVNGPSSGLVGVPITVTPSFFSASIGTSTQKDTTGCERESITKDVKPDYKESWYVTGIEAQPQGGSVDSDEITFMPLSSGAAVVYVSESFTYPGDTTGGFGTDGWLPISIQDNPISIISYSLQDVAGPKYRKIALNGAPLADEKPQATEETDEDKEESFIDAFTDTLHHSVTDVYVPLPGGALALSVRRNVTTEIWGQASGTDPEDATHPRPDRPFGYCWSSNLTPNVEIVRTSWTRAQTSPDDTGPDIPIPTVNVTDENGDPHRFRIVADNNNNDAYYPYPQSYEEKDEYLNSLVVNANGTLTFKRKYSTTIVFAKVDSLSYTDVVSQIKVLTGPTPYITAGHTFYQVQSVSDRFGNKLDYSYENNPNGLIPSKITFDGHPSQNIQIHTDSHNHVTSVTDPRGNSHSYNYLAQTVSSGAPGESGSIGSNRNPTCYVLQSVQGPANGSGAVPVTNYAYDQNSFQPEPDRTPIEGLGDTTVLDPKYHVDLSSITDPNGKSYVFQYDFDLSRIAGKHRVGAPALIEDPYPTNGNPRVVTSVVLPDNLGSTRISKVGVEKVSGFSLLARPRSTCVHDSAGNSRIYSFTDYQMINLSDFHYGDKPEVLSLVCYGTTTISYIQGAGVSIPAVGFDNLPDPSAPLPIDLNGSVLMGHEIYSFDLASGMALSGVVDFSGNPTTYEHGDAWKVTDNGSSYSTVGTDYFPFTNFSDPTAEVDALNHKTKFHYFTYGPDASTKVNRVMDSILDRNNHLTKYSIDSIYGRRLSETIYSDSMGTNALQETDYTYDGTFRGFVASKKIKKLGGSDPSWAGDLEVDYVPDSLGRVQKEIVDPHGLALTTTYSYDLNNNKTSVQDPRGNTTSFEYDNLNQLTEVDYPATDGGAATSKKFFYDPRGNKTKEIDENGHATLFSYDGMNRMTVQARDMNGNGGIDEGVDLVTKYGYNGVGSKVSATDPNGNSSYFLYDGLQRLVTSVDARHQSTDYQYGANSGGNAFDVSGFKPTQISDPRPIVTTMAYDKLYRNTSKSVDYESGKTSVTGMGYDDDGNLTSIVDPLTNTTLMTYDALNRVILTKFADLTTKQTVYSSTGLKVKVLDELSSADPNRVTDMVYDGAGRLTDAIGGAVDNGSGVLARPDTHTDYDLNGNVADTINPRGYEWVYTYDERNRKKTETQPAVSYLGASVHPDLLWGYDGVGNVVSMRDANHQTTTYVYDVANRKTDIIQPTVNVSSGGTTHPTTHTDYDFNGNAVQLVDANLQSTINAYDELDRLTMTTDAANNQVVYGYDPVGNRTSVEDGRLHTTSFTFDGLNRLRTTKDPDGKITTLNYDALNKTSRVDPLSQETVYSYDLRNRLTGIAYTGRTVDNRVYGYDPVGNLISVTEAGLPAANVAYTYDALNRAISETSCGKTHAYLYDLAGNRLQTVYGGTSRTIVSSYDTLNRLQAMTETGRATSYGYDLNGNITGKTLPNGDSETIAFDSLNRASSQVATHGGASLYAFTYQYDAVGNLTITSEAYPAGLNNRIVTNSYDGINRLHIESVGGGTVHLTTTYTYDASNNRQTKSVTGDSTSTVNYTYDDANALTSYSDGTRSVTLTYDDDGNRTGRTISGGTDNGTDTYSYDYENRLVGLVKGSGGGTGSYTYQYDYRTRRIVRDESSANGTLTSIVFSGGTSVQEYDGSTPTLAVEYIRGSDYGGGVGGILYTLRNGGPSYTHENRRGDVVAKTDATGALTYQAQYEAFGNQTANHGTTLDRQKSNSKDTDPTGLVDEGFRYRDLDTGMFINRDPAGFVDGPNLYAYVVQNPWTKFDPEGLTWWDVVSGKAQAVTNNVVVDTLNLPATVFNALPRDEDAPGANIKAPVIPHVDTSGGATDKDDFDRGIKSGNVLSVTGLVAGGGGLIRAGESLVETGAELLSKKLSTVVEEAPKPAPSTAPGAQSASSTADQSAADAASQAPKGSSNPSTASAANRGSSLHSDKPGNLPDQLRSKYPDTQFKVTKPGETGQDVQVTGGTHPSDYPDSKWASGKDHGDFKPDTPGGRKTFNQDQKNKWSQPTQMIPYNSKTGKLTD